MTPDEILKALKQNGSNCTKVAARIPYEPEKSKTKLVKHRVLNQDVYQVIQKDYFYPLVRLEISKVIKGKSYKQIWGVLPYEDDIKFVYDGIRAGKGMQPADIMKRIDGQGHNKNSIAKISGFCSGYVGMVINRRRSNQHIKEIISKELGINFKDLWG
jgi:lambda repressor-like predicted transcriptional regulator